MRQVARGAMEAARPAAEHEGIGVGQAVAFTEQPVSVVARELGIELVEQRVDPGFGMRLDLGDR